MMTVNEVSKLTGVSIRTLQYYDNIGLLKPAEYTESGYRLYDDTALETLQQILLFRELEFPLKAIKDIIGSSDFDRRKALDQQIELLTLKKEHLENLISFARGLRKKGAKNMDFSAFDTAKIDEYAKKAKEQWGNTAAYKEYERKAEGRSKEDNASMMQEFMGLFTEFGKLKDKAPESADAQAMVEKLKDYISEHFYNCTDDILAGLGKAYATGNEFTENIDKAGGAGTAFFASKAIEVYCAR
ncbi:MAG: MerR family transcriptional regulator [Lachnospiraceae bacterium]|nr:MerR family transcriptional regulator [Lachnospiraceae bacterium]